MSQYSLGTVSVTNGSAVVTGLGSFWVAALAAAQLFEIQGEGVWYSIESVDSDTQITLATNYVGTTKTGSKYVVQRDFTPTNHFPTPTYGDVDVGSLLAQTLLQIDAALVALSPISEILQGDITLSGILTISAATAGGLIDGVIIGSIDPVAGTFSALAANASFLPPRSTVAALPTGVNGMTVYATDGRKIGEGASAGTGQLVCYSNGHWRRVSDDAIVAA